MPGRRRLASFAEGFNIVKRIKMKILKLKMREIPGIMDLQAEAWMRRKDEGIRL